jgi:putative flippase GtrA
MKHVPEYLIKWCGYMGQFIKFCLVGLTNVAVSLAVYYAMVAFNDRLYVLANICGYGLSILSSYLLNSRFVFKNTAKSGVKIVKTYISYGITLAINTGMIYLLVELMGISTSMAPILCMVISVPANFFLNKFWVYRTGHR